MNSRPMLSRLILWTCIVTLAMTVAMRAQSSPWATAYYAGWQQGYNNSGYMPAQSVDYSAVTHIVHFALVPKSDGTLDDASNSVSAYNANQLVTLAHAAGKKVIICVGGWATESSFLGATNSTNVSTFVSNLVNLMQSRGYDGIDIDWEPLSSSSSSQFGAFITKLRTALDAISPRPLLTTADGGSPSIIAPVSSKFDQINIMSYDLSGAWGGWVTWHNSPIYDGGFKFPSTGGAVPSADGLVNSCVSAGIPASKLGIGIDFYGYVWSGGAGTPNGGATDPRQSWTTAPTVQSNVPYSTIMDTYYQSQYYKFDNAAGVSYLSIDNSGSTNDKFISYDDEATVASKYNYVKTKGIGGAIIWELGGGYRANMPSGQRDLLLQAVKKALGGTVSSADVTPPTISLTGPTNGATVSSTIALSANATDNVGVAGVQFKIDGANLGSEDLASPYTASLTTTQFTNGAHTLSAVARDAAGNTSSASVTVTISNLITDTTPPTVALTSPTNGATISGSVNLSANASDNIGVVGVQFSVDGSLVGSEVTLAPFTVSWNSASVSNASHTVTATARDLAGNKSTSSATVTVSNSSGTTGSSDLLIFADALQSPWVNNSWSATVTFGSTEQAYAGTSSIKTVLSAAWGALSAHDGSWGTAGVTTSSYKSLDFAVYPTTSTSLSIFFENDAGQSFPGVSSGTLPANTWTVISIPVTKLNPNGQAVNRVDIQDVSGAVKTFYVDNFRFVGTSTGTPPSAPSLTSPANLATSVTLNPTLNWNAVSGASTYELQLASNSAFTSPTVDKTGLTATSYSATGLASGTVYYWRVNASNSSGTGSWSGSFSFTTAAAPDTVKPAVSFTSPANSSTVSGTVSVNANASDNVKVVGVQFQLDGSNLGSEIPAAPYGLSWVTSQVTNGSHTLTVTARDSAGNKASASVTVTVSNTTAPPAASLIVFQDALASPWIDASWSATITYGSTDQVFAGTSSIKVAQNAWGALRVHSGPWGAKVDVNTSGSSSLDFAINGGSSGISLGLYFENDLGQSFPSIKYVWIPSNQWTKVSYPISQLNPNNQVVDRIVIQDMSGRVKTFYLDNLQLTASTQTLAKADVGATSANPESNAVPTTFDLAQNYPNPFNPSTTVQYSVPALAHVSIEIFNVIGQRVEMLVDRDQAAGQYPDHG